ncbi:MAG: hypothetical protein H7Y12_10155, partial [Sphingobacteriaceae bacterium]|nr:hypothetical protein [Cytophagaceae bacterium]
MSRYSTLFYLLLVGVMLTGGLFITQARAQNGRYDVRFTLQEVACPKVRIQLQVKAHTEQTTFRMGDANFRFDYNPTQLKNPVLKKQ